MHEVSSSSMICVVTIIVNYRTPDLVLDCLRSMVGEINNPRVHCRVIVVDNNSGDRSMERIEKEVRKNNWLDWVELIPLPDNRGFAAGNNAALEKILASYEKINYIWLLNPDTVIRPGALEALVDFLEANPKIGIAGSRLEDPDGSPARSAFRFPTIASELENGFRLGFISWLLKRYLVAPPVELQPHQCDWVSGASMLIRQQVFSTIGTFDEAYFLYYEETDFCLRARRARLPTWYVPTSRVVHLVGQSSGDTNNNRVLKRIPRYMLDSRARYFSKNHGRFYRFLADLAWSASYCTWRLRRKVLSRPDSDPPFLLRDFLMFNFLNR